MHCTWYCSGGAVDESVYVTSQISFKFGNKNQITLNELSVLIEISQGIKTFCAIFKKIIFLKDFY
jgi:hypothetical protein